MKENPYRLVTDIAAHDFDALERFRTLLISQQPQISIELTNCNYESLQTHFQQKTKVEIDLFDFIPIGTHTNTYTFDHFEENSSNQSVTMYFNPPGIDSSTVGFDQTAFILGGVIA